MDQAYPQMKKRKNEAFIWTEEPYQQQLKNLKAIQSNYTESYLLCLEIDPL